MALLTILAAVAAGVAIMATADTEDEDTKLAKISQEDLQYQEMVLNKVNYRKSVKDSKGNKKIITGTGYVQKTELDALNLSTVPIPANFAGLEAVMTPTRLQDQLFEIVDVDEEENEVTITARHIWYRNLQNNTLWKPTADQNYTAAAVCRNILTNAIFPSESNVASDCTDTKPGKDLDFERKNLVEAFLDPEKGVCKLFGLSLIRDNMDFYCLKEVGFNRGFVVEAGKNMLGVERQENIENLATRIAPIAKDAKGAIVWLDYNGLKYIDSQYINDYASPRLEIYDTGLVIGKDGVTAENVQEKLLAAAQKRLSDDKVDLPEVTMRVEFVSLGDTEEYKQYRDLDKVYLYDIITVKDPEKGYNYAAQVIGVEHDILTGMLNSVTIGSLKQADASRKIAVWQVPEVDGANIRLLSISAGSFEAGAIQGDDIGDYVIQYAHFASATVDALNAETIEAVEAQIETIIAGHITAESIKASAIDAINATLGTATITNGLIDNADIGFAHIQAATAESLIARDAVTDRYFIDKLQVRNLQSVEATVGELVVKASNGNYYKLDVGSDGSLSPTRVYPTAAAIAEGKYGNGAIIETDLTVADLSASNIKGINALIDKLTASRIDVDELFARQAFIGKLNTTDISSNTYLQLMVNAKNKTYRQWATPSDPHEGDVWYKQAPQPISEMENYTMSELEQYPMWAFDGYELYRYESNAWRLIDDPAEIRDTIARILMENDRIDIMVAQLDTEMDNKYTIRSGIAIELAGIEISGSKYVLIKSGGSFKVHSGNFDIDESGNVSMTGRITAASGKIGGFDIGATRLSSGSGSNYICVDSGTSGFDYFLMAGGTSASNAKFLLGKDGSLVVESLTVKNEQGTTAQIDLSNYALWKLNYNVIKSYSATSITLSNGATINFNSAAGLVLDGEWNENALIYEVIATNGQGQVIGTDTSPAASFNRTQAQYKADLEASGAHQVMVKVAPSGHNGIEMLIDASGVYAQGETAGEAGVTVTGVANRSQTYNGNLHTYNVSVRGFASNGATGDDSIIVTASEAYGDGVKDGNNAAYSNQYVIGTCYQITAHNGDWVKVQSLGTGYSRVAWMS